ncbi:ABC transporter permease [Niabella sp. W65]|nr:ABC transporter permease [Niabella sp. W65]MCH7365968.1 ABC transporter permease [Niabella sp. W65]
MFGVTIGIFCIIGVLATVNSLQRNIQNEIKSMGDNIIFIDKWVWSGGPDYPWWKFVNRPYPKYHELKQIKERSPSTQYAAFFYDISDNIEFGGSVLSGVKIYGASEEYNQIQKLTFAHGRYISDAEFNYGTNVAVIGDEVATKLFTLPEAALNKDIKLKGRLVKVIGVIKKQGKQLTGGWDYDKSIIIPYTFAKTIYLERFSDPKIMVKGYEHISNTILKDELEGVMRSIHRLSPTKESDFALNDLNDISKEVEAAFVGLNIGGAIIGGISLIVGLFGVANIMFVTVKERTPQIGLKKAIGAKRHIILTEFLLEAAFLCIIGGIIGLGLVVVLAVILTKALEFPIYVSVANMAWTFCICILVGIIAGVIPAMQAAKMDPVVAIRS